MFEARLAQGKVLKMIVEAMKDLVTDANLDAAAGGLSLQVRRRARCVWVERLAAVRRGAVCAV
jgi:proliferating cell nuclear antigen|tara:strand:+ start:32 stop:220 length:189 start_codon:yes stop_codon:yes gene_type:complete